MKRNLKAKLGYGQCNNNVSSLRAIEKANYDEAQNSDSPSR